LQVAAFLDPLFHADLLMNKDDYETAKKVVTENMQEIDVTSPDISTSLLSTTLQASLSTPSSNRMKTLKSSLMNTTNKKASPPLSFQPISVELEMATFLNLIRDNEMTDFQTFWKTHSRTLPRLSQITRRYNVIPATSVYSEQLFSVAGAIKHIRRASMSSLTLRSMMILKKKDNIEKLRPFSLQQ
jgi:phenylpropionate dioxygenase-like ring-hydroxylating dioxygenase large terminal subunit